MPKQQLLNLQSSTTYDANNFFVSKSNAQAYAWIDNWPNWPSHCLILHGPSGCGKSHLAHIWQQKSHAQFIDLSKVATKNLHELCQASSCLIVDHIGNKLDEEILLHIYNLTKENN